MGAPDVLAQLSALGVTLSREGDALIARPRSALTDQARDMIRAHKQELLAALGSTGDAAEARRQWAIAMLAERPDLRVAVSVDSDGDPVRVAVAIRDKGTCEIHIPAAAFDPFALLELVGRHGAALH